MSVGEMSGGFDRGAYVRVGKRLDPHLCIQHYILLVPRMAQSENYGQKLYCLAQNNQNFLSSKDKLEPNILFQYNPSSTAIVDVSDLIIKYRKSDNVLIIIMDQVEY